jgi:tetratricopeptide (TPR) repeat protein
MYSMYIYVYIYIFFWHVRMNMSPHESILFVFLSPLFVIYVYNIHIYIYTHRISCQHSIWPSVALIQFYQYIRGNLVKARRVLHWVSNRRKKVTAQSLIRKQNAMRAKAQADPGQVLFGQSVQQPALPEDIQKDIEESLALLIAEAYCSLDGMDLEASGKTCAAVIESDGTQVAAHRCIALIEWSRGSRIEAMKRLESSYTPYGAKNPYFLRTFSVANALMGSYARALSLMKSAVDLGPLNALSWRALGLMSYLYDNDRKNCLDHFSRAFELSNELDLEAICLRGQVLMELGRFEEARLAFRTAMKVSPGDPVLLANMALCLCALGHKPQSSEYRPTNFNLKFELMDDLAELAEVTDPEELFEAAVCTNLEEIVKERRKRKLGAYTRANVDALGKGWAFVKKVQQKRSSMEEPVKVDQDAPPNVLYWYGLWCLNRGIESSVPEYNYKAKTLFKR